MNAAVEIAPAPSQPSGEPPTLAELSPDSPRLVVTDPSAPGVSKRSSDSAGWLVSLLGCVVVLLGILWGAYALRADIMAQWPASAHLYSLLGVGEPER